MESIKLKNINISDGFWRKFTDLVQGVILPYQWEMLNGRLEGAELNNCLKNFRIAAGDEQGEHSGPVFVDTDLYKWLEAVAYSLESKPDPELEKIADDVIRLISRVQLPDGYVNTYYMIAKPEKRWSNLVEGHELYSAGYMIEAAVAYFEATGKNELLNCAMRFADLLCRTFGKEDGQIHGYPGHQEIELALIQFYKVTGREKYRELAMYFINERGGTPNYFLEEMRRPDHEQIFSEMKNYDPAYSQSHIPPRRQRTAEGHAVRATYMYSAMADLADMYQDQELMQACESIWENIVTRRMYLTGSIGSSAMLERFTTDYDLPNDVNYSETCASIGMAMFGSRMARIKYDASYIDVVERALYNTVLAGISLTGNTYFYVNPLEAWPPRCMEHTSMDHVKPVRQQWFNVACCPTNIARTLASLGKYMVSVSDEALFINLFIASHFTAEIKGIAIEAEMQTTFPNDGDCQLDIKASEPVEFTLNIRVPGYARNWSISLNGEPIINMDPVKGYAAVTRLWSGTTRVDIHFDFRAEFVCANPEVRADSGKVAISKGPLVYCLEEVDNGSNLSSIFIDPRTPLDEAFEPDLFGGTTIVKFKGRKISPGGWDGELYKSAGFKTEPVELTAIPYCYWANRGENEMIVWMHATI